MCKHILFNNYKHPDHVGVLNQFNSMTFDNDGFGFIAKTKNNILSYKTTLLSDLYLKLGETIASHNGVLDTLVVHHRTSTNGQGANYAHPFYHESSGTYFTHNGVVSVETSKTYDLKTTNDSELLMHHLLDAETPFNTKIVNGYFSCFLVNNHTNTVVVDRTAPIYVSPCGIVYSSHKIGNDWTKIEAKKIDIEPVTGRVLSVTDIELAPKNDYGSGYYSKSLGFKSSYKKSSYLDYDYNLDDSTEYDATPMTSKLDSIIDMISSYEIDDIDRMLLNDDRKGAVEYILELTPYLIGQTVSRKQAKKILKEIEYRFIFERQNYA